MPRTAPTDGDSAVRRMRGRIGGLALAASRDPREYTAPARAAALQRFEKQVDPTGTLPPDERARRAEAARKLYFTQLAYKSVLSRRRRKNGGEKRE